MARKVLVSLVSEQTIPNVELIKEFKNEVDDYLFISTEKMQNQLNWIIEATDITALAPIIVKPFDIEDIENKLKEYKFEDAEYILNITGGTKLMTIIIEDFFKNIGAKIFYVTGYKKKYLKVFPSIGNRELELKTKLTLKEYLTAYGFKYKESITYKEKDTAEKIFNYFIQHDITNLKNITEPIRIRRKRDMHVDDFHQIKDFLNDISYTYSKNKLNKKDTQYLSGDWLEEYIYYQIKEELNLDDSEIATGITLTKENTQNEIDVVFIFEHKLYIIECKTSIIDRRKLKIIRKGEEVEEEKDVKLLPEIIYKSDALRAKLGLFANTVILTLEEIKNEDGTPIDKAYENNFERAKLSRIQIISKRDFMDKKDMKELLKIFAY
ncbi:MAG: DUF1887 family protein [Bacteroidales bacterium]|nr:DUF1887 family protein [Bacteroidales bacterium]